MALKFRKRVLLLKIESAYGTDPTPTGAANALLVSNLTITPIQADLVVRGNLKGTLGGESQLHVGVRVGVEFDVEMAGAGSAGRVPAYGPVLRSCAMSETINQNATGTAQAGGTATITLAAGSSAVDDFYNGMEIEIDGGTGSGQAKKITDYVGTTKIATVESNWTTPPDATSTYDINDYVTYAPISASEESSTIYFYLDGMMHEINGVRGSIQWMWDPRGIPHMRFTGMGLYVAPIDTTNATPTLTAFQTPLAVTDDNTTCTLHAVATLNVLGASVDQANNVVYRNLIGQESVDVTDRQSTGQITIELPAVATLDVYGRAVASTTGNLILVHGTTIGNISTFTASTVQLLNPTLGDTDGIATLQIGLSLLPSDTGDDEWSFKVH